MNFLNQYFCILTGILTLSVFQFVFADDSELRSCLRIENLGRKLGETQMRGGYARFEFENQSVHCSKLPEFFDASVRSLRKNAASWPQPEQNDCWYMGVLSGIYYERDFLNSVCKLGTIENTDERKEKIRCYNATIKEITEQNKANKFFDSEFLQKLNIRAENSTFPSFCFEGNHEALIQYVYH